MEQRLLSLGLSAEQDVVAARQRARQIAGLAGFGQQEQTRIATAASELARNAYRYTGGGRVMYAITTAAAPGSGSRAPQQLRITVSDTGQGIADLEAVLGGAYKSTTGMGLGLIGTRRLMDHFEVDTGPAGTRVVIGKNLPAGEGPVTAAQVAAMGARLAAVPVQNSYAEIQQQNRELLDAYRLLKEQNEELQRVTAHAEALARTLSESDRRKDEFLATLAHELRNPLAPIRASIDYLRIAQPAAAPGVARAHAVLDRQSNQMARLVDDLLDVARITRGKLELKCGPVEMEGVIQAASETVAPFFAQRGQKLEVQLPGHAVQVYGDAVRLSQVVGNLLHNAGKYSPPNARVHLSMRIERGDVSIAITDQGIGLSAEALPTVFDLFVQAGHSPDLPQVGLGIGLSLVKGLVEMHGGSVSAASEGAQRGSTFTVRLPLPQAAPAAQREGEAPPAASSVSATGEAVAAPRAQRRILVVDDNVDAAESLAMLMEMDGHRTRIAHDPEEALAAVREFAPEVVLLDIGLPGKDGYQVLGEMRPLTAPGTLFIALTGYGQDKDRQRARDAGFAHHLTKPIDTRQLQALVA